ncbi:MAG: hypothetical protein M3R24_27270, partial [Chloroflexota bacterium]|nr:hypothetical protein [Chloroflexota bacterium]
LPQRPSSHPDWSAGTCRPATQTGSSADKTCCLISTPFLYGSESSASIDAINGQLRSNGLPNIETYDLRTTLSDGTMQRFMPNDVMVFACLTGRDETIEVSATEQKIVSDTLGYMAVGVPTGALEPGRTIYVEPRNTKPRMVYAEGYEMTLPVLLDPEAFAVITGIA